jgi:hypothetical protein
MDPGDAIGGAMFLGGNLLVVLLPTLVALWLALRAVRALERSAKAHERAALRLDQLVELAADTSRTLQDVDRRTGSL